MPVHCKRVYQRATRDDGYRVLVDRLWPRGVSRQQAKVDAWLADVAPSDALRKWFHQDASRWNEFRKRYLAELKQHRDAVRPLAERARSGAVTLLYGSRDERRNNAVVLAQYLRMLKVD